jgi:hypothetical protein
VLISWRVRSARMESTVVHGSFRPWTVLMLTVALAGLVAQAGGSSFPPGWDLAYMTHLDVGYTLPLVEQVVDQHINEWFPKAFNTAQTLQSRGGPHSLSGRRTPGCCGSTDTTLLVH